MDIPVIKKPNYLIVSGLTFLFFLIGFAGILQHEMWLDEMHHWLIARESNSQMEMFYNIRNEGHPPVWNIILFGVTRLTSNPYYMQLVHLIIASMAVFVFLKYGPFSLLFKTATIFGYYFIYEYLVISRNYAPGLLLLWIILSLLSDKTKYFILLSILLGVLANVHLFFLFVSLSTFLVLLYESREKIKRTTLLCGIIIYAGFVICAFAFIIPVDFFLFTHYNREPVFSLSRLKQGGSLFIKAFVHIPDFTLTNSWNNNYIFSASKPIFIFPAFIYLFIPLILLYRNPICVFIFYFPAILVTGFLSITPLSSGIRYVGLIYIFLLVALWYQKISTCNYQGFYYKKIGLLMIRLKKVIEIPFFAFLFITQIASTAIMYWKDYHQPFSQAERTMQFLEKEKTIPHNLAVSNIAAISSLGGFTHDNIYSLEAGKICKFWLWDVYPFQIKEQEIIKTMKGLLNKNNSKWILVTNHLLIFNHDIFKPQLMFHDDTISFSLIKHFTGSLVGTENFYVYRVTLK